MNRHHYLLYYKSIWVGASIVFFETSPCFSGSEYNSKYLNAPYQQLKDQVKKEEEKKKNPFFNFKDNATFSSSVSLPLSKSSHGNYNPSISAGTSVNYKSFSFFLQIFKFAHKQPFQPDFSFGMGYFNWSPGSFSFGYRNDSPNRLIPSERDSEKHIYPSRGSFFLSYRFEIPQKIQSLLDFGYKDPLSLSVGLSSTPVSFNKYYQKNKEWQSKTSLSLSYAFSPNLSFNINPILYISEHSQESWDPDFTYCLDYTLPIDLKKGKVKLSYSNYGATRYPWKKAEQGAGSRLALREGSIGIIWILS